MLLGFKKRFVMPIKIGTKVHTLRKQPKREPKIGEKLYMYTGLRTANCEFISDTENLRSKQKARIIVTRIKGKTKKDYTYSLFVAVDGRKLSTAELSRFVKFDGFDGVEDFCQFWFIGENKNKIGSIMNLYHWTDLRY